MEVFFAGLLSMICQVSHVIKNYCRLTAFYKSSVVYINNFMIYDFIDTKGVLNKFQFFSTRKYNITKKVLTAFCPFHKHRHNISKSTKLH